MIAKALPALFLLALPALAAPNRPPPDNTFCGNNATKAPVRMTIVITPVGGGARVERAMDLPRGQASCVVGPPGQADIRAEQPGRVLCQVRRDGAAGQMQFSVRVEEDVMIGFNGETPSLSCRISS